MSLVPVLRDRTTGPHPREHRARPAAPRCWPGSANDPNEAASKVKLERTVCPNITNLPSKDEVPKKSNLRNTGTKNKIQNTKFESYETPVNRKSSTAAVAAAEAG